MRVARREGPHAAPGELEARTRSSACQRMLSPMSGNVTTPRSFSSRCLRYSPLEKKEGVCDGPSSRRRFPRPRLASTPPPAKASPQRAECDRAASHMATITAPARNACTESAAGTSRSSPGKWAHRAPGHPDRAPRRPERSDAEPSDSHRRNEEAESVARRPDRPPRFCHAKRATMISSGTPEIPGGMLDRVEAPDARRRRGAWGPTCVGLANAERGSGRTGGHEVAREARAVLRRGRVVPEEHEEERPG